MATPTYIDQIADLTACKDALGWLRTAAHPDLASAWAACPQGDWMLWLAGRLAGPPGDPSRIPLVLAACDCAELALPLVPAGEDRPRRALEVARAWARGEATLEEVRKAADAAAAASRADVTAAAGTCTYVPAAATYAAAAAATAVTADTADIVNTAATATRVAYAIATATRVAFADTHAATLYRCADIVRRHFPSPPSLE